MNRELAFLRAFAVATVIGMIFITTSAFKKNGNQKFKEIDVERIKQHIEKIERYTKNTLAVKMKEHQTSLKTSQSNTAAFRSWIDQ